MKRIILLLALTQAGCSNDLQSWYKESDNRKVEQLAEEARQRDANPNQYSYKLGMQHGCDSGGNASGNYTKQFSKDIDKYVKDAYYKSGWDDGFAQCKGQGEMINDAINKSL